MKSDGGKSGGGRCGWKGRGKFGGKDGKRGGKGKTGGKGVPSLDTMGMWDPYQDWLAGMR